MTDFERYLEEARIQSESEEAMKTEAFVNRLDRERVARIRQYAEDPTLMWKLCAQDKVTQPHTVPVKGRTVSRKEEDSWWMGYMTGTIITALLALSALFVWWLI